MEDVLIGEVDKYSRHPPLFVLLEGEAVCNDEERWGMIECTEISDIPSKHLDSSGSP